MPALVLATSCVAFSKQRDDFARLVGKWKGSAKFDRRGLPKSVQSQLTTAQLSELEQKVNGLKFTLEVFANQKYSYVGIFGKVSKSEKGKCKLEKHIVYLMPEPKGGTTRYRFDNSKLILTSIAKQYEGITVTLTKVSK